jgi:ribonucleoside-diphosphate reductase alpha chain
MQAVTVPTAVPSGPRLVTNQGPSTSAYQGYQILRRNGAVVAFEPNKIAVALMKAFLAVHGTQGAASASVRETVDSLTETVVRALLRSRPGGGTFHIEDVQDHVELGLMRGGHHEVARAYVLYRERRTQERAKQGRSAAVSEPALTVLDRGQRIRSTSGGCRPSSNRRVQGWVPMCRPHRSWPRQSATCMTACRSTRCIRPRSWPLEP